MNAALQSRTSTQSTLSPVRRLLAPCLAALAISGCIIEVPPEDESSTGGDGGSSSSSADASSTSGNGTTGSGTTGSGDASSGSGGLDPYSLWDVILVDGEFAGYNVGSDWDGDGSPPDSFVGVKVGSSGVTETYSTARQDTYYPTWNEVIVSGATAIELQAYFKLSVLDEDISAHDLAGSCEWIIAEEFFGYGLPLSCPQGDGLSGYDVNIFITPH
jgi:hypothetical protein